MPIDASIPLQVKQPAYMTPQQMMSLQSLAQQSQMNQMQMQDMQQERQERNALKDLMSDPSLYDPATGQPSKEGLSRVFQVSPKAGVTMQQNMLKAMQEQSTIEKNKAQAEHYKEQSAQARTKMKEGEVAVADKVQSGALSVYNDALPKYGEQRAKQLAEEFRRDELERQSKLGIVSPEFILMGGSKPFDPVKAKAWVDAAKPPKADAVETPFMRELRATGVQPGSPEWNRQLQKHLDKMDAPARTTVKVAAGGPTTAGLSKEYNEDPAYKKQVDFWAETLKNGGTLPPRFAQSGAGKKMFQDIVQRVPQISGDAREMLASQAEFQGIKAGERTLGTRSANIELAVNEADQLADLALKASNEWKRFGVKSVNDLQKAVQSRTASPELRQFVASNTSFINAYARAISPSGVPTVSDKDHAREMLDVGFTTGDYAAAVKQLKLEMQAAARSPAIVRGALREAVTGKGKDVSPPKPGDVQEGYRFKGGNPADPKSWEKQ
jgi:hypothetical protein